MSISSISMAFTFKVSCHLHDDVHFHNECKLKAHFVEHHRDSDEIAWIFL